MNSRGESPQKAQKAQKKFYPSATDCADGTDSGGHSTSGFGTPSIREDSSYSWLQVLGFDLIHPRGEPVGVLPATCNLQASWSNAECRISNVE